MTSSKIFHLYQDRFGLSETYQDIQEEALSCVLCDALYLPKPEESPQIAREFERVIKKYLSSQNHGYDEKILKKCIEHAQTHFFKKYPEDQHLLKITALIFVRPPPNNDTESLCYILGIGDFKLFKVDKPPSLLFYDSETSKLPLDLSLKKRFHYLTNAIGQPYLKNSVLSVPADKLSSLVIMSYGTYNTLPEEKWLQYLSDFENKKHSIIRAISRSKEKEHFKQLFYISSFKETENLRGISEKPLDEKLSKIPYLPIKKSLHFFQWAYKIAIVVILGLCILELTHSYPSHINQPSNSLDLLKSPIREPDMQLHLRSFKKPFRFPFIKERAFLVDLKEKYDRQVVIIDALNDRIQEQDKALRDLQIKRYKPTPLYTNHLKNNESEDFPPLSR